MVLVTGGTGLIGSHLLYNLISKGERVRAIYRSEKSLLKTKKVFESYTATALFPKIEWVQADITDYFSLNEIFENIEYVYHAAAIVSFNKRDLDNMMNTNVDGTAHLVNLSLEYGIRKFCFVSSVSSLGDYEDGKCTDEEALWQMSEDTSNYSVSKYYAENEVWRASEEGLDVVIVNPATVIGFGDWTESSSTLIKRVKDGLQFYPTGSNGFVGVKDVVIAMIQLMESNISGERFLLVSENWTFKKLFSTIAESLKLSPPKFKVGKLLALIFMKVDQFKSFILHSNVILTKETVNTAFNTKCYSSEKIQQEFDFKFTSLEEVINDVGRYYS